MLANTSSVLGAAGMIAIEASYLPQIARLHRLKRSEDVSLFFPALNLAGRLCALAYSLSVGNSIFGLGFVVGAALRLTLLLQVAWYRRALRQRSGHVAREPATATP